MSVASLLLLADGRFPDGAHAHSHGLEAAIDAGVSAYVVDGLRKERIKAVLDLSIARFNAFRRLQDELHEARSELADRKTIDRAKALIMRQRGLDEEAAYTLLRSTAMRQSRRIVDIASALVTADELLGPGVVP